MSAIKAHIDKAKLKQDKYQRQQSTEVKRTQEQQDPKMDKFDQEKERLKQQM